MATDDVWIFTRPGFENEGGREWLDRAALSGVYGSLEALDGLGITCFRAGSSTSRPRQQQRRVAVASLVFVRDAVVELGRVHPLPKKNRVDALLHAMKEPPAQQWGEVMVHVPDGSDDGDLSAFARKWTAPVASALRRRGWLAPDRDDRARRLDLVLLDFDTLVICESFPDQRADVPGGRPRLRLIPGSPSRSTLKLEEAFLTLLSREERDRLLAPGATAVDLGAAPGGWSFHLVRRNMLVTAVDNGPMDESLMRSGQVEHLKTDGYTWLPERPVDWMVCDIVDKPRRTIDLVGRWFRGGHCDASVFNLKLPMKKRLEEWYLCRDRLDTALRSTGRTFQIRAKQLYHDREELTVVVLPKP